MKICDKCEDPIPAVNGIATLIEDEHFDLCDRHMIVLIDFLREKEKLTLFGRKQKVA